MGLEAIDAWKVSCQRCEETIVVEEWQDARKHGWAVPSDGHLHLCPKCVEFHKGVLSATAVPA